MTYKTQGIILKHTDLGENSRQLSIYTKDFGKVCVQARAAKISRAKLAGHLEPLTLSQLVIASGKFLDIVIDALAINNFRRLCSSLKGLAFAIYACELVDKLTGERVPDERVFGLLLRSLEKFNFNRAVDSSVEIKLQQTRFGLELLVLLGFAPEEELNQKDPKVLEERFRYYLNFAPEQNIQSEEFLNEMIGE